MCTLYENIISLCSEKGIKGGKMCVDIGISKSTLTDLKAGRKRTITAETAKRIAEYFGVSVNRVLNGSFQGNMDNMLDGYRQGREDERSSLAEKAPTPEGEHKKTASPPEDGLAELLQKPYMKEIYDTLQKLTPESLELVLSQIRAVGDYESNSKKEASPPQKAP